MLLCHLLLGSSSARQSCYQFHYIVIVYQGRGKKNKFKVDVLYLGILSFFCPILLLFELLCYFKVGASEASQPFFIEHIVNGSTLFLTYIRILVKLCSIALYFLEAIYKSNTYIVTLQIINLFGLVLQILRMHKVFQMRNSFLIFLHDCGGWINKPNCSWLIYIHTRESGNRYVHSLLLPSEIENITVWLGIIQDTVCS